VASLLRYRMAETDDGDGAVQLPPVRRTEASLILY
jgi:hypothetical protein